jgi:nitroreductase
MPLPTPNEALAQLQWRYAAKQFDATKKIPDATWDVLVRSLVLAPSSFGLQPWKFVVVNDPAVRKTLQGHAWGQSQVTDASHFVVLAVRKGVDLDFTDRNIARIEQVRGTPAASMASLRGMIGGFLAQPGMDVDAWSTHQVYIALGQFMTTAAMLEIDTCPMEGIDPAKFDDALGLTGTAFATRVAVAAGYRSANDKYASLPKVRFEMGEVVKTV